MKFTRYNLSTLRTPRSVFILAFLCCIVFAQAADPHFDKGSASLAKNWQGIKGSLPHDKIPNTADKIQDVSKWAMPYAISVGKVVGPGFAIAVLSLLGGIVYGLFKLVRLCLCGLCKKDEDGEASDDSASSYDDAPNAMMKVWCPTIVYVVAWVFLLTGMCFGLLNNPRFSQGVDNMGDSVINVGNDAVGLAQGLLSNVTYIVSLIPSTITGLEDQFAGVDPLSAEVTSISISLNGTSGSVNNITAEVGAIDAGNTSAVNNLYSQLASINNQSQSILSSVSSLTDQIAVQLSSTLNSTLGTLDSKTKDIDSTVGDLQTTAKGIIDAATKLVKQVIGKVDDVKSYDKSRGKAVLALFVLVIIATFAIVIGYFVKFKVIFNVISALSFVFLFFLWFSGSIHFMLGIVLYDACPVIDVTVQGLLPKDSSSNVLRGCLYEHRTVLESMNISAYNLSAVFDYKDEFEGFADFSKNFNFSAIDAYFTSIQSLYKYNLTEVANNMTVSNFGWNETVIYTALDTLNNQTYPKYYDLKNYTDADTDFHNSPPPKNQTVHEAVTAVTTLLEVNATIYNKTEVAQKQLYAAQHDIDNLLSNITLLQMRYGKVKATVNVLQTKNISNCIDILDDLQANITGFFELGNCSFLGDSYVEIRTSLCETMQPAIDCLTVAQFLAGLALIPIAILAEFLSFKVPKNRVSPCGSDSYDDGESGKESYKEKQGYAVAMTDSPMMQRRAHLTATVSTAPPSATSSAESTPASTPDFNANRRVIAKHYENRDD